MLLLTHILVAIGSILFTSYMYLSPSKKKLATAYALAGVTLSTGTVLLVSYPAHLVPACISGIIYLGIVMYGISLARKKLATQSYL